MPFDEINREFSFPLQKIIDEYKLEVIYMPEDGGNTLISDHEINRPGLQFAGFYEYFDKQRIQVMGRTEHSYLSTLEPNVRRERIDNLLSYKFPALIITRDLDVFPELVESAKEHETTLLRTDESSSVFTSKLVNFLNLQLAPRITRHGVLIEIYGEGVLILGVKVPLLAIPVKPGRNLAVILEVAAMNNRMKKMGYNAAKDLLHQLGIDSDSEEIMSDLNI